MVEHGQTVPWMQSRSWLAVQGYGFNAHHCETNPTSTDFITSRKIATVCSSYTIHCLYLKKSFSNNFNHFLKINILNVIYSKSKLCILTLYLQLSLRLFRWNGGRAKFLHRLAEKMRAQFVSEVQLWSMAWIKIISLRIFMWIQISRLPWKSSMSQAVECLQ